MRRLQIDILNQYGTVSAIAECQHITLKQAFEANVLEPFERYFDRLVNEIKPFEIVIKGIGSFDQGIIFLDVEQDIRLKALRLKILRDLSEQFGIKPHPLEDERYYFHATLAHKMSKADFAKTLQELKDRKVYFRFVFDTLGLFYFTGEEWITYKRSKVGRNRILPLPDK
jgi:2'-5' RNA ligase